MTQPSYTVGQVAEMTGLTKKAIRRRCERGTLKYTTVDRERRIPLDEVDRLMAEAHPFQESPFSSTELAQDQGTFTSTTDEPLDLSDPDSLLRERGLEPDEWEITHLKVNEWDGPNGQPNKQLTVNVKRKRSFDMLQPAYEPDTYEAPAKNPYQPGESELVVLVGDQQAPYYDPELHRVFNDWLRENKPNRGVLMGDTVDFPDISRHQSNPEHDVSPQECINSAYLLLRDYVQSSEQTRWTKLMGNHDERIRNRLISHATGLSDIRQAEIPGEEPELPIWSVAHLLRLEALGIDFIDPNGGYSHAQHKVSSKLAARHGWVVKKGSGASALGTLEHLGYSVVVGHTHRQSIVHKTKHDIDGTTATLAAAETGCMCRLDGLGYTVAPDWQNGFCTATVYPDGTFKLDLATYVNGTLYWRDQRYG